MVTITTASYGLRALRLAWWLAKACCCPVQGTFIKLGWDSFHHHTCLTLLAINLITEHGQLHYLLLILQI